MSYYNRKRSLGDRLFDNFEVIGGVAGILLVVAIVVGVFWSTNAWVNTKHSYANCVVTGKESVNKDKTHEYRVYTDKCGVFQVSDELWLGKFNSADTYNALQQGKGYNIQTVGWRNGFFSSFENIVGFN
jgi:hypothetical protein